MQNWLNDTKNITRLIWLVLGALLLVMVVFASVYIWDRYVFLGDPAAVDENQTSLEDAVREDPADPDARVSLAQHYYEQGDYDEALQQSEEVLGAYPEHDGALLLAGLSHIQLEQRAEAVAPLTAFVEIRSQFAMSRTDTMLEAGMYFLGETYVYLNQPEPAINVLEKALIINSTDADAMYQLGVAYSQTGEHQLALEQYRQAVRFVPDFLEAYSGMEESYTALDQMDHAAYAQGMVAYVIQDYDDALAKLNQATAALPDFMPAFLGLGLVQEQMGDLEAARTSLMHASELEPGDFLVENTLGRIELALGGE